MSDLLTLCDVLVTNVYVGKGTFENYCLIIRECRKEWSPSSRPPCRCPCTRRSYLTAGCPGERSYHLRTRTSQCPRLSYSARGRPGSCPEWKATCLSSKDAWRNPPAHATGGRRQSTGWLSSYLSTPRKRQLLPLWMRKWDDDVWIFVEAHTVLFCRQIRMTQGFFHASKPAYKQFSVFVGDSPRSGTILPLL